MQSCARVMTVESRVESRVMAFSRAEFRVNSRVISLESESSRVIAKVSRVMSRVIIAQLVVSSKLLVK